MYDPNQPVKAYPVATDAYARFFSALCCQYVFLLFCSAPSNPAVNQPLMSFDEGGAREVLSEYKWPEGLQGLLVLSSWSCVNNDFLRYICEESDQDSYSLFYM